MRARDLANQCSSATVCPATKGDVHEHRIHARFQLGLLELDEVLRPVPVGHIRANRGAELRSLVLLTHMLSFHLLELRHGEVTAVVGVDEGVMGRTEEDQIVGTVDVFIQRVVTRPPRPARTNVRLLTHDSAAVPLSSVHGERLNAQRVGADVV